MGGWANSLLGITQGLGSAVVLPDPSLSYLASLPPSASATAGQGAPGQGATPASGGGTYQPTAAAGGTQGRTGAGPGIGAPPGAGAATANGPSPGQISAYRSNVENALSSIYGKVSSAIPALAGGPGYSPEWGEAVLTNQGIPAPAGAPTLTAAEAALLGPGISESWPFGPGPYNVPGTNLGTRFGSVRTPDQTLSSIDSMLQGMGFFSNFYLPGTAPGTFFPANQFGDVTGGAVQLPASQEFAVPALRGTTSNQSFSFPQATAAQLGANAPAPLMGGTPSWVSQLPQIPGGAGPVNPWTGNASGGQ